VSKESCESVFINGVEYVRKDVQKADKLEGTPYCIVRTYSAGVFAGYLQKREGQEVIVRKARRIWQWSGAASLSQLAVDGTNQPQNCKFPVEVDSVTLTQAIEIIECTEKAQKSIASVPVWKM
jgi:hypothetical protein